MLSDKREQWDEKRDDRPMENEISKRGRFLCDAQLLTAKEQDKQQWVQQIMDNNINAVSVLLP